MFTDKDGVYMPTSRETAKTLSRLVYERLTDKGEPGELTRIEIKEMPDGSGNWALLVSAHEHEWKEDFRWVVNRKGRIVGSEGEPLDGRPWSSAS